MGEMTATRRPVPGPVYDAALAYLVGADPPVGDRVRYVATWYFGGPPVSAPDPRALCREVLRLAAENGVAREVRE